MKIGSERWQYIAAYCVAVAIGAVGAFHVLAMCAQAMMWLAELAGGVDRVWQGVACIAGVGVGTLIVATTLILLIDRAMELDEDEP